MEDTIMLYNETFIEIERLLVEKITHSATEEEKEKYKKVYLNWIDFKNDFIT